MVEIFLLTDAPAATAEATECSAILRLLSKLGCKQQNLKNKTERSGPKSEYYLNQPRSGAVMRLTCSTDHRVETRRWLPQVL